MEQRFSKMANGGSTSIESVLSDVTNVSSSAETPIASEVDKNNPFYVDW